MERTTLHPSERAEISLSFEYFPPKNEEMEAQLFQTVADLSAFAPAFQTVTYGAGGSTKARSLTTVRRMIGEMGLSNTAAHLTCVGAPQPEVDAIIEEFVACGVRHFVALRGDPQGGVGSAYQPFPGGYENAAALVKALRARGDFEISVSAYPEKHPESRDAAADIDMLKRKVDNGATRAITQFFFDNDDFERYLDQVRRAGIEVPVVPGILPINNLSQVMKFAGLCGSTVPDAITSRLAHLDDQPEERFREASHIAAEQIVDLVRRGVRDFHIYTMNRSPLVIAVCELLGYVRSPVNAREMAVGSIKTAAGAR
ncbi:methylenetetrahydrofolate reductase [NAD(P)H] [Sinorhizobium alkalisoli]|uniref:Methylenetetrahydrofolate reductase n=1 Tax=Sinorhizobium alkalisoli TaxID=1752398 RepID=A0A1E3V4X5_9HYPH|nr:methylenetetrahydrofolate reductase [NAD(P)H] [Sinorhizobium alkalisoli]MCA1491633.1 methylenetetrahydrofolate reductase [NAD(P)H] [Ensifer sp. NBAIM29]MCG5482432.1 methylenetetrahydrofolate reductase [NAD(P)H] [Sinorhizobium meliloti]ODR88201.1 methylenetetrahydrofolate reductase [NAD(P)H] [Sinorhizobium alkalisoli]QFI67074.1 5,10-methylenetetrahydrofolate reductase [Sinorhizobium alkalisoli]